MDKYVADIWSKNVIRMTSQNYLEVFSLVILLNVKKPCVP